jgi:catechol 2,3-dioxygenase-like lactoylglutathione lyase family enzyme
MKVKLVPELDVTEMSASLNFYVTVCGFTIRYERPEERFAYLERDGVELMLEQAEGPGRRFRTAPLEKPFGRGVNFQIEVRDVDALLTDISAAGYIPFIALEERWYRTDNGYVGHRQFAVADPDGYVLRFFQDLGSRQRHSELS